MVCAGGGSSVCCCGGFVLLLVIVTILGGKDVGTGESSLDRVSVIVISSVGTGSLVTPGVVSTSGRLVTEVVSTSGRVTTGSLVTSLVGGLYVIVGIVMLEGIGGGFVSVFVTVSGTVVSPSFGSSMQASSHSYPSLQQQY